MPRRPAAEACRPRRRSRPSTTWATPGRCSTAPGRLELMQETMDSVMAADAAVVVCEPDPAKAPMLAPLLRFLDEQQIPPPPVRQQDRGDRAAGARPSGGAAGPFRPAAGAAPGTDPRGRGGDRLCRPGLRTRLCLPSRPAVGPRQPAGQRRRARAGGPARDAGGAGRLRRRAAGATARGRPAGERRRLPPDRRRPGRRPDRAGDAGRRRARPRRAPAVEGAAPRRAGRRPHRGAARRGRGGLRQRPGGDRLPHLPCAARRQAEPCARLARHRQGTG